MRIARIHRAVIWSGLAVTLWFLSAAAAVAEVRPCTCRYAGESYAEGQCVCMSTSGGQRVACCGKVLNNTSWSFGSSVCPVAQDVAPAPATAEQIADSISDSPAGFGTPLSPRRP